MFQSAMSGTSSLMGELCDDVVFPIFNFLSVGEKFELGHVNRALFQLFLDRRAWQVLDLGTSEDMLFPLHWFYEPEISEWLFRFPIRTLVVREVDSFERNLSEFLRFEPPLERLRVVGYNGKEIENLDDVKYCGATLRDIEIYLQEDLTCIGALSQLTELRRFHLKRCQKVTDFIPLSACEQLRDVNLDQCQRLSSLEPLLDMKELRILSVCHTGVNDLFPLRHCERLHTLRLDNTGVTLDRMLPFPDLVHLSLNGCTNIESLRSLARCIRLETLSANGCVRLESLRGLSECKRLRSVSLNDCQSLTSIADLGHHPNDVQGLHPCAGLHTLHLDKCVLVSDVSVLDMCPDLRVVTLNGCIGLATSPLPCWPQLQELSVGDMKVSNLATFFSRLPLVSLRTLSLKGVATQPDTAWLARCSSLTALNLANCPWVSDLSFVSHMPGLQRLHLTHCAHVKDLGPLARCLDLRYIDIMGCTLQTAAPLPDLPRLEEVELRYASKVRHEFRDRPYIYIRTEYSKWI